ncbi:MAG: cytochrome c3 family protein [Chloroflexota bacterium]|nr:MAG: cytochrome c3 family protein [Chloroflexota bacterium]
MKKLLLVLVLVSALSIAIVSVASADNGPHGGFTPTADGCAGCHRAHTASGPNLLVASSTLALCYTCHNTTGTGADTNVEDGVYLERDGVTEVPTEGDPGRGLKAGGFANALMDSDLDATAASAASTSAHTIDLTAGTLWGNGAISAAANPGPTGFQLDCANCHDPHGSAGAGGVATYRILRDIPNGSGGTGTTVGDETNKWYTVADLNNQYWDETYGNGTDLASWCSECHTRYLAGAGSGSTDSGDAVFMYRHRTDAGFVNCMSCHVAHGSSATMGTFSGAVEWPDGATTPNGDARSSLLRVDNRGVCQQCHNK